LSYFGWLSHLNMPIQRLLFHPLGWKVGKRVKAETFIIFIIGLWAPRAPLYYLGPRRGRLEEREELNFRTMHFGQVIVPTPKKFWLAADLLGAIYIHAPPPSDYHGPHYCCFRILSQPWDQIIYNSHFMMILIWRQW
jgi:hypothetical protein